MCGIAGFVSLPGAPPADEGTLTRMAGTLIHRGPDDEGFALHDGVGLAVRRLAVIDIEGGHQPLANEDGSVRLVYNGEIYDFRELQSRLGTRGHTFRSGSDGEVLAHLWEDLGTGCLREVNGMFALALHDRRRRRVMLARDRLGIKPLYYARTSRHIVFGSEIKALLASGLVERQLDLTALGEFMAWEYVPAPATLFRGIHKLAPGELMEIDLTSGRIHRRRYWDVPPPNPGRDARIDAAAVRAWEERTDAKIRECVARQLVSDVPLGAFLSGGVDSSLVVAGMDRPTTFSIGFDDPSYNELRWSEKVARHLGVRHVTEVIRPDSGELFGRLMHHLDDPIGDFSIFPTFLISRLARSEVTVALSGDGGDELFGGYETYLAQIGAAVYDRIPGIVRHRFVEALVARLRPSPAKKGLINKARRFVEGARLDPRLGHARWRQFLHGEATRALFSREALAQMETPAEQHVLKLFDEAGPRDPVDRMLYVDLKSYLADNCLVKVDRMSMACSLENRVPLLDHELVELAFTMPPSLKVGRHETKVLLKKLAARRIPRECAYRPKEGFSSPVKHWLRTSLKPLMYELLDRDRMAQEGIFDPGTVAALQAEHLSGQANHSHVLWCLLVFHAWQDRWLNDHA
jgi:asparagine synthase (glutamine-hydrolysing)